MVEAKGFGLGLSIVQQLTALNLGQVDVHSTEGKGSCFAFTLPGYDCEPVVDAVLERAAVEEASPHIAVLDVALLDGLDIASVIERVALSCYSSDVIWPARSNGHLLIIGATRHVEEWRSRVLDLVAEGRKPRDSSAGVVREIRVAGQWPIGQARDELLRLMAPVYGEPVDATLDSDR